MADPPISVAEGGPSSLRSSARVPRLASSRFSRTFAISWPRSSRSSTISWRAADAAPPSGIALHVVSVRRESARQVGGRPCGISTGQSHVDTTAWSLFHDIPYFMHLRGMRWAPRIPFLVRARNGCGRIRVAAFLLQDAASIPFIAGGVLSARTRSFQTFPFGASGGCGRFPGKFFGAVRRHDRQSGCLSRRRKDGPTGRPLSAEPANACPPAAAAPDRLRIRPGNAEKVTWAIRIGNFSCRNAVHCFLGPLSRQAVQNRGTPETIP